MKKMILQPSERNLIEELWKEPQTLTQLYHCLNEKSGWSKSTVHTMLKRMVKKDLIGYQQGPKAKVYYPKVDSVEMNLKETQTFLKRVYHGSISMMMNTLIKQSELSSQELQELKEIIEKAGEDSC